MELTKRFYIKRKLFGFKIMVEYSIDVEIDTPDGSFFQKQYYWRKASELDLIELNIHIH